MRLVFAFVRFVRSVAGSGSVASSVASSGSVATFGVGFHVGILCNSFIGNNLLLKLLKHFVLH